MTILVLTAAAVMALAFANGANDVSKGIATLAGSRRATYRQALAWGTLWTAAGSLAAVVVSAGLAAVFTSSLVDPSVLAATSFPLAVAAAACVWVLFATAAGLPVSTTHALTGAIVGVAFMIAGGDAIRWTALLWNIAVPLALSPLVAAALGYGLHGPAARLASTCVCVEDGVAVSMVSAGSLAASRVPAVVTSALECDPAPRRVRLMTGRVTHWGSAAAISFARAMNDTPKIVALGTIGFAALGGGIAGTFTVVATAMALGSIAAGLRVSRTLGERVVHMEVETGLAGAVATAGLVLTASFYTLPVSTTHVSTGAIIGAGMRAGARTVHWRTVSSLVTAWFVTLPVCALLGAAAARLLSSGAFPRS